MKLRSSRVLKLLREGQLPTCLKINLADPRVIELAGLSGVDAFSLCMEHVPNDWSGIENQVHAARVHNIDSLVRVAKGSYVKQRLEVVQGHIAALPAAAQPPARSPYV